MARRAGSPVSQTDSARILIVEDDSIIATRLASLVHEMGYVAVDVLSNGADAVQRAVELHPDVILMDIHLSGEMDGVETAARIQARTDTPIIYLTAYTEEQLLHRARLTGPYSYLVKPVRAQDLRAAIEVTLHRCRLETQLRESNQLLEAILEHTHALVAYMDAQFNFVRVNRAYAAADKRDPAFFPGKNYFALYPNAENEAIFRRVVETGEPYFAYTRPFGYSEHPEHGVTYWDWGLAPIRGAPGEVTGLVLTLVDVTERVRAQDSLRRYAVEQAILYAVASAMVASLEPVEMLQAVLNVLLPALHAEAGWVALADAAPDSPLRIVAWRGFPEDFAAAAVDFGALPHSDCPAYRALAAPGSDVIGVTPIRECRCLPARVLTAIGISEHVSIPLYVGRRVLLGVLNIAWRASSFRGGEGMVSRAMLSASGQGLGIALHNARLYQAARQVDRLRVLNMVGAKVNESLELDTVLRQVLHLTCEAVHATEGSILLRDRATDELVFAATSTEATASLRGVRLAAGQGIAGWIVQHGETVRVSDVERDPRYYDRIARSIGIEIRALCGTPLKRMGEIIGVLEVINKAGGDFTDDDVSLLEAVSSVAAAALENARLFTATRERAEENARLYNELKAMMREREEAQAHLIHAEKMAAIGRLAASIAHEVNNPLQAVLGCMKLADEELHGQSRREKLERHLAVALAETQRIAAILRRMHDFYRRAREEMRPTDLHAILEDVLALSARQLQHSHITLVRDLADAPLTIHASPDHLKQVFLNLVLNAIDAMPQGGVLRVATARSGDAAVRIQISDTGVGMSPETQAHLFEPFFTTKEHGTGLGLSISYNIIESHGGKITVSSQVGAGTTFTITLPVEG